MSSEPEVSTGEGLLECLLAAIDMKLLVDIADMAVHGVTAQADEVCDFIVGVAFCEEAEDLQFPACQCVFPVGRGGFGVAEVFG